MPNDPSSAGEWLKERKAPPPTPAERRMNRRGAIFRAVGVGAVVYLASRFLELDIVASAILATGTAVMGILWWFD